MVSNVTEIRKPTKTINCYLCGREIKVDIKQTRNMICPICKEKTKELKNDRILKNGVNLFKKLRKIYHKSIQDEKLQELIESVYEIGRKNLFYGSKEEVAMALEFSDENIQYECQKEIGEYRVDFFLPALCVVVEIDGEIYHDCNIKHIERDEKIKAYLGDDWEVVRIPCLSIDECIEIGAEKSILVRLEEMEHYRLHGYDEKDKFWSDNEMSRRREYDH